jgi:hypothetical protein
MAEAQVVVSAHVRMVGIQDPITCQFLQRWEEREKPSAGGGASRVRTILRPIPC